MSEEIIITNSREETLVLAEDFSRTLKGGDFLAFYGNLGSGKTTFIQGLAKGLGIKKRIISPTFIIVRTYDSRFKIKDSRFKTFYHVDLYRTESRHDLLSVGLDEIIQDKNNIVALEWAQKLGEMLPKQRIDIRMRYIDENKREITIKRYE
jgi:tRNA threonylcarbamoyladenosine biosynthesis protein TsaE